MSNKEEMQQLNKKIREAEAKGLVPKILYIKQIELLEKAHKEFIKRSIEEGYNLSNNLDILEIELKQFGAMKQIAKKLGISTQKYDNYIKEARIRVLGKEATETFFKD